MDSWAVSAAEHFQTEFYFTCEKDFLTRKLPGYQQLPVAKQQEIKDFYNSIKLKMELSLNPTAI